MSTSEELRDDDEETREVALASHFVVFGLDYRSPNLLVPFQESGAAAPAPPAPTPQTPTLRFRRAANKEMPSPRPGCPYKGQQLHRFPKEDVKGGMSLPGHLWLFVFPTGVTLELAPQPPCFFVNALTFADGSRSYVTCIKFYERTPWSASDKADKKHKRGTRSANDPEDGCLFAPKAICYVSDLPLFAFFKAYLAQLFMNSQPSSINWV